MKTMKIFLSVFVLALLSSSLIAQDAKLKSESFKVSGNCDMCKNRIETAAKSGGASTAAWDAKSQMLTVKYDGSKTNPDAIAKKVAAAGHDTKKYKAEDKTYKNLPSCCQYSRTAQTEQMNHSDHSGHSMPAGHSMH